ncbi:hypothetical protein FRX31_011489 [Thalictrum thalictroides]|uniref:Reverse transcriptase zinc-binding domain-containing protein n=1 Tax=Thalictrum thalictroides TaxID=46969 RepID=A0A7J6WPR9_THATH|nr:hypothetical protein FRX31_011489 [Thalictrum thalictroides]
MRGTTHQIDRPFPFKLVWKVDIPMKVKFFLWTLVLDRTLTTDNLRRRGTMIHPVCCMCESINESIPHLLMHCSMALRVWKSLTRVKPEIYGILIEAPKVEDLLERWTQGSNQELSRKVWRFLPYATLWTLWKTRNNKLFKRVEATEERICKEIKWTVWYWCASWKRRKKYNFQSFMEDWEGVLSGLVGPCD